MPEITYELTDPFQKSNEIAWGLIGFTHRNILQPLINIFEWSGGPFKMVKSILDNPALA